MAIGTARQSHEQQVHYLRKLVNYNDAGLAGGVLVGTVPAGALLNSVRVHIATAFTTANLAVGTTGTGTDLASTSDTAATATGAKSATALNSIGAPFANDQDIFVSLSGTNTAGVGYITVSFIPNNDR